MKLRNKVVIICSIILIILSLAILLFSCLFYKVKMEEIDAKIKELKEEEQEKLIEEYENKDQYIGVENCFLGTVSPNNEWKSANEYNEEYVAFKIGENVKSNVVKKDITSDDILENKSFYFYDEKKLLGKKNNYFFDKDLNPEYYNEIYYFRFNAFEYMNTENDKNDFNKSLLIATSKVLNNEQFSRVEIVNSADYKEYEKYVQTVLDEKKFKTEANIDRILISDSDSNGEDEIYILANSKNGFDENNITEPLYSYILKVENEKIEIILERAMDENELKNIKGVGACFELDGLSLIDFNNDGKLEIVASGIVWDIPEIFVFRINETNETELCLYGNFAW